MVAVSLAEATWAACGGSAMTLGEGVLITDFGPMQPQPHEVPLQVSEWHPPKGNGWTGSNKSKPPAPIPRLARTVRVGAITFTVRRDSRLVADHNFGESRLDDQLILLSPAQSPELTSLTLLHELLHTIGSDRHLGDALTEPVVDSLANGLAAVLQDLGWMPKRLLLAEDP